MIKKSNDVNLYNVTSILLMNNMVIPIKSEYMSAQSFKKYGLGYEFQSMEEVIDNIIIENEIPYDDRIINVKNRLYRNEAYNLFRLELSIYLSNNISIMKTIIGIVRNTTISKKEKRKELMKLILDIIENNYKNNKFIEIIKELPMLNNYNVSNIREQCNINKTKDTCNSHLHCIYITKGTSNMCMFTMYKNDVLINISKIIEEMMMDSIKFKEIIQEDAYYVSDIVDYTQFSNRENQKIIKTSNFNIKKIMAELFGKESVPQLGKYKVGRQDITIIEDVPEMIELGKQMIQEIISNKNSIIRAYVNCYYWMINNLYDKESRNLGYESELQNKLTNLFKANIIDFIANNVYNEEFKKDINKYIILDKELFSKNIFSSSINRIRKNNYNTDTILELIVLSYMFPYPIVVYDNYNTVKYIYSSGPVSVNEKTIAKYTMTSDHHKTIFIKCDYEGISSIPNKYYSIYYI
jgi:hypothetical protein